MLTSAELSLQGRRSALAAAGHAHMLTDFDLCRRIAARAYSLPLLKVSTSIIHVNAHITTHLLTPKGWWAELA